MMGYRDMTFCEAYKVCQDGAPCERALTEEVLEAADEWWGKEGAPICKFVDYPECFVPDDSFATDINKGE